MRIFSLNVWFENYLKKERLAILIDYIIKNNFDIILLQEITIDFISDLYKLINNLYNYIHIDLDEDYYGTCIISNYEIKDKEIIRFKNSKMRRGLILCNINSIIFATSHLESEFNKDNKIKIEQFNNCIKYLSKFNNVLFIGDTNLTTSDEKKINTLYFKDVYLEIDNSLINKYTYDGKLNPLLNNKIRSRIDRCYVKNIKCKDFNLEKEIIMSDHFGIIININE